MYEKGPTNFKTESNTRRSLSAPKYDSFGHRDGEGPILVPNFHVQLVPGTPLETLSKVWYTYLTDCPYCLSKVWYTFAKYS